jgi:hypothetical protein
MKAIVTIGGKTPNNNIHTRIMVEHHPTILLAVRRGYNLDSSGQGGTEAVVVNAAINLPVT